MTAIYLVSTSARKRAQFAELLGGAGVEAIDPGVPLPEPQTTDIVEVALQKLLESARHVPMRPLMVDDTGLTIPALGMFPAPKAIVKPVFRRDDPDIIDRAADDVRGGMFPGALLKPILELGGVDLLERMTRGLRSGPRIEAEYVCVLAVAHKNGVFTAVGRMRGELDFSDESLLALKDTARVFYPTGASRSLHDVAEARGAAAYGHRVDALASAMAQLNQVSKSGQSISEEPRTTSA